MKNAKIIIGQYAGICGKATEPNAYGNVMFYPDNQTPVYRICKKMEEVEYVDD